ncbi:unnamed protein product [Phaedon cochleariae]|uniref:Ankyrin repeat domain-containing protein 16 n=1 Tax=Phaedon cochleariae TaxID=80249 RepID=A0A9P0DRJ5_PHACE|nr:unnamed protein product [Phaedon cochleariae]
MLGMTMEDITKTLREAQNGNKIFLETVFQKYPDYHWSQIYYKATGDTLLHCAARLGHINIIKYLLSNFVPISVDCKNKDDKTALHEASQFLQFESCEVLLRYGAEVNALKRADWTPLMLACTKTEGENSWKTIKLLLEHGALVNYKNKDGWTCVHLVARQGNVSVMKLLLQYGLDAKIKTKNGRSALHIAALHGKLEIVELLLGAGLDIDERDNCGNTPLHEAALGHINICELLINHGANINLKNNCGLNVVHLTAATGNIEILRLFLSEHKLDINDHDNSGFTSLHYASRAGKRAAYDFLVSCGACEEIKDNFGRTPQEVFTHIP